jgi:primosomal protein N' (replication factor Y)
VTETTPSSLLEVAVALPVRGTYTYRDPRGAAPVPLGTQVVVPFGARTVTGFVVGHPAAGGGSEASRAAALDVEQIVAGTPAFDDEMIALCRWAADYYQAPLGEVLRAALPQGEKATAVRSVRLTEAGRRALARQPGLLPGEAAPVDRLLAALDAAGGVLPMKALARLDARASAHATRLQAQGLVEIGDEVKERKRPASIAIAVLVAGADLAALPARAAARRALAAKLAAQADGVDVAALSAAERTHLKALVTAGLARVEHRAPAPGAPVAAVSEGGASGLVATPAQESAIAALTGALAQGFATFLLHGVTGSGKTEVYLRIIATARAAGRGALVLVPEIALTPQLASRFRARFGDDVAVLHSALPPGERLRAWRQLRAGEVGIAVGARSAIFAPVQRLGVLVVDEEHDGSFKQDDGFRYNARDLAVVRAQRAGAVAILGSATPSLETFQNAEAGRFRRLSLPERATPRPLPSVEIVDLRRHPVGPDGLLSAVLADAVAANLAAREQTILFRNRRGFSTAVLCRGCGEFAQCENCAVSMTYHRSRDRLVCHYCGEARPVPTRCSKCESPKLERVGMGTERLEAVIRERFPDARVARLDRDTSDGGGADEHGSKRGLRGVLEGMQSGSIDILVGTQMVAKGHDFPGVTLVGVLQPDAAMNLPDFRATERVYQLLEQVSGRAGRGQRPGRVMIQTYKPNHFAFECVVSHDYRAFVEKELAHRRDTGYPPFSRLIVLRLDSRDADRLAEDAKAVAAAVAAVGHEKVRILGPAPAPIERVRGRTRYQIWMFGRDRAALVAASRAGAAVKLGPDVRLAVDVDPQSVL